MRHSESWFHFFLDDFKPSHSARRAGPCTCSLAIISCSTDTCCLLACFFCCSIDTSRQSPPTLLGTCRVSYRIVPKISAELLYVRAANCAARGQGQRGSQGSLLALFCSHDLAKWCYLHSFLAYYFCLAELPCLMC